MTLRLRAATLTAFLGFSGAACAQQPNPLDVIPDKMPFNIPYGAPISLSRAQAAIAAATAEAEKRGWALNVAVVDSGPISSPSGAWTAPSSARSPSPSTRRAPPPNSAGATKAFEEAIQKGNNYPLTIDDVIVVARRHSPGRGRQADRRDRLFRRRRLAGRGRVHGRRGDDQQIAPGAARPPATQLLVRLGVRTSPETGRLLRKEFAHDRRHH